MDHSSAYLSPIDLHISDLLLDPNNPRFAELADESAPVPESRFSEPKVQQAAYEKMKNAMFNVMPMDRLLVHEWRDSKAEAPKLCCCRRQPPCSGH
jgi:hypothetical protein